MPIIRFFSDPHEGKVLKSNTNPASRALLAEQIHLYAMQAASFPTAGDRPVAATICAGDLFDTHTNPEKVLLNAAEVAAHCDFILGGNHDVVNIAGQESSLSAIAKLTARDTVAELDNSFILPPEPGQVKWFEHNYPGVALILIPHHARQEEFERAIGEMKVEVESRDWPLDQRKVLVLHCNYDQQIGLGPNDLNLTEAKARWLLQWFDYIVLGHDHRPRLECDGRLIILGSTHPTSFSDLGEKRVWFYDTDSNTWEWAVNAADASIRIPVDKLLEDHRLERLSRYQDAEWIDIEGDLPPEGAVDLAKAIRALWKQVPYAYAIRASKVRIIAPGLAAGVSMDAQQKNLIQIIAEDLEANHPDLLDLFEEASTKDE